MQPQHQKPAFFNKNIRYLLASENAINAEQLSARNAEQLSAINAEQLNAINAEQ